MNKNATINARIDKNLKNNAENILHNLGISTSEAIRIFYNQVCINKGLPFLVKFPTTETLDSINQLENENLISYQSMDEIWNEITNDYD